MTRALFVTVASDELYMPVSAWRNSMGPAAHITYNAHGPRNDEAILACARGYQPEVIFYIGCNTGEGIPALETHKALRDIAPCVHYQSDVEDEAWFFLLEQYRRAGCFDLIVGQTGVKTDLIDMATLAAVDMQAFEGAEAKYTLCGFAGTACDLDDYKPGISDFDGRAEVLQGLSSRVTYRRRQPSSNYQDYVRFLKRCLISINVSLTGSGKRHHVKWRVLESAFADCALLEMKGSPTREWFPDDTFMTYGDVSQAWRILGSVKRHEMTDMAGRFSAYAREHYNPKKIYTGILEALPK